ncbi:MAG: Hsp70 family protein [Gemmataceae bacterium]|nr:Hsp70 family protein [Gemmataceae bacterium]MDW8265031.1 Hsp70 family protein [Gemmataceae bacterium]
MANDAGKVVGIDLGTTYSAIATLDERGQPITLPNREGEMLTPSAVLIDGDTAVVGQAALDVALERPQDVATLIKRRMGYASYGRPVAGRDFRPETLSALILRKLVQDAEHRVGPIRQAVITVPAYFDDTRRKATKDAGRIAGLDVLDILDEPTAAALAYSYRPPEGGAAAASERPLSEAPQTVLVYDLGGGTFDVTVVRLSQQRFQTLAIEGDVRLGGKDWDDRIVDHVAAAFRQEYGEDPRSDPQSLALLQAAAERAKRTLSKLTQTRITCAHAGKVLSVPLTRAEFEAMTRDLLTRTRLTVTQVLRQARLRWEQIDRILLVGGSTHMPMTGQMLRELSGKNPDNSLAVSEVVARGAAIHGGIVTARSPAPKVPFDADVQDALRQIVEINVISHSLGIEVRHHNERINDILIVKNTQLPAAASRVYRTSVENQPRVRVKVLQGEAHQADACINIGECWIDDLPPNLPKGSPIQVRCSCGSDGLIDVMALDMTSGRMARVEIHRSSGLSEDDLARERAWVASLTIS